MSKRLGNARESSKLQAPATFLLKEPQSLPLTPDKRNTLEQAGNINHQLSPFPMPANHYRNNENSVMLIINTPMPVPSQELPIPNENN